MHKVSKRLVLPWLAVYVAIMIAVVAVLAYRSQSTLGLAVFMFLFGTLTMFFIALIISINYDKRRGSSKTSESE